MPFSDSERSFAPRTLDEAGLDWGSKLTSVAIERQRKRSRNRMFAALALVGGLAVAGLSIAYDKFAARFAQKNGNVTASETAGD